MADTHVLIWWIRGYVILAAICSTSFPLIYLLFPWRSTLLGKLLMIQAWSFALAIDGTLLFSFWKPNIYLALWANIVIFTLIAGSTASLTWMLCRTNHIKSIFQRKKEEPAMSDEHPKHLAGEEPNETPPPDLKRDHLLSNQTYDVLKYVALVALPAVGTLYFAIAQIWGIPYGPEVVGSVTAFDTFLGVLLRLGTRSYNNSEAKYDGFIDVDRDVVTDKKTFSLNLNSDPYEIEKKNAVTFKVNPSP